ncbi:MAG: hypothetical protein CM1200mP1_16310 [Candidatus Neomarinimicrobiota bacterium]|nr:MAG: hypothetical protein CM1200mP1_16310 [Candidatus Neomarinimicrobiota bacterium]
MSMNVLKRQGLEFDWIDTKNFLKMSKRILNQIRN